LRDVGERYKTREKRCIRDRGTGLHRQTIFKVNNGFGRISVNPTDMKQHATILKLFTVSQIIVQGVYCT
jgi:hypothetical protein